MASARLLAKLLHNTPDLQTIITRADDPWTEGPELLDGADAAVLFVSEGAKWLQTDAARLAAFQRLAKRGGGLVVLHWGMGTKDAANIEEFVKLFGGCHGGPDRKYQVVAVTTEVVAPRHPIMRGVVPVTVHEEFYYTLKFAKPAESVTPLLKAPIDGQSHTVAWAWERPDAGRSFGFSGLHFHKNWEQASYRRMVTQAILWTLKRDIPETGIAVEVSDKDLSLPPAETGK
jgi:type 1 glutamine amidotransferase